MLLQIYFLNILKLKTYRDNKPDKYKNGFAFHNGASIKWFEIIRIVYVLFKYLKFYADFLVTLIPPNGFIVKICSSNS